MTREEFIKELKVRRYSHKIEGDKIIVNDGESVDLRNLTSIPPGTVFKNEGWVDLDALTSLPPGTVFENEGDVYLNSLTSIPPGTVFKNEGWVDLESLTSIPPGTVFENEGNVHLKYIIGGYFNEWEGNIRGIASKRLLNKMIKDGVFER
jgi:5,10-methenyltetrahydromethanopterin hydrogenase